MSAIDSDALKEYIKKTDLTAVERGALLQAISNMSTLTPPNEPLTWNELGNMMEKPVYIVELEDGESCWVLVHTVDDIKALIEQLKGEAFGLRVDKQELEQYRALGPIDRLRELAEAALRREQDG